MPEIGQEEPVPDRWSAAAAPGLWVDEADDPRFTGEDLTDERSTLVDYLRAYRITLKLKCADLDAEQLARRSVPPSTMSLLGLIRHLAQVERNWFRSVLAGLDTPKLYTPVNADWDGAVADPAVAAEAWQCWRDAVDFAAPRRRRRRPGHPRNDEGRQHDLAARGPGAHGRGVRPPLRARSRDWPRPAPAGGQEDVPRP